MGNPDPTSSFADRIRLWMMTRGISRQGATELLDGKIPSSSSDRMSITRRFIQECEAYLRSLGGRLHQDPHGDLMEVLFYVFRDSIEEPDRSKYPRVVPGGGPQPGLRTEE